MRILIHAILLLQSGLVISQPVTTAPNPANLDFMKGDWKGNGWMMTEKGRSGSSITEHVECKVGCSIYVAEGLGKRYDSVEKKEVVVHDAFGVTTYDKTKGKWILRAFKNGMMTESELSFISDMKFSWSLPAPGSGKIRFTTDFSSGKWVEIGEFSRDEGATWMKIMEMSLEKVK